MSAYSMRARGAIPAPSAVQGNIVGVHLGPRVSYLEEIRPSNPRFAHLTSYRRYRLQNTPRIPSSFDRSSEYWWIKNMAIQMRQVEISGSRPIELIKWLNTFVTCCNQSNVPEELALNIAERFLRGNALEECIQAKARATAINEDGGFTTWPGWVNHLISTHLTDQVLQEALDAVNLSAQAINQPVR